MSTFDDFVHLFDNFGLVFFVVGHEIDRCLVTYASSVVSLNCKPLTPTAMMIDKLGLVVDSSGCRWSTSAYESIYTRLNWHHGIKREQFVDDMKRRRGGDVCSRHAFSLVTLLNGVETCSAARTGVGSFGPSLDAFIAKLVVARVNGAPSLDVVEAYVALHGWL